MVKQDHEYDKSRISYIAEHDESLSNHFSSNSSGHIRYGFQSLKIIHLMSK